MTPLAAVSDAARRGILPVGYGWPAWIAHPLADAGSKALAAGELWGDKLKSAPDRIVPAGILARLVSGAIAGASVAPRRQAVVGGVLGATAAVGAAYLTFGLRMWALERYGQKATGLIEDALAVGAAEAVVHGARRRVSPPWRAGRHDSSVVARSASPALPSQRPADPSVAASR